MSLNRLFSNSFQQRQSDGEGGAFVSCAFHRESSIMLLYDAVCNRQSEAGALALGCKKRVKNCFQVGFVDT